MSSLSFLNPLDHVLGHKRPPTFGQKVMDTFEFYAGFPFEDNNPDPAHEKKAFHAGIFDWLTFGIPTLILLLNLHYLVESRNKAARIAAWTAFAVISLPLLIVRAVFAGIMTLVSLIFVVGAQWAEPKEIDESPKNTEEATNATNHTQDIDAVVRKTTGKDLNSIVEEKVAEKIAAHTEEVKKAENPILEQKVNDFRISKIDGKPTIKGALAKIGLTLKDVNHVEDFQVKRRSKKENWHQISFFKAPEKNPVVEFKVKLEKTPHKEVYDALCTLNVGNIKPVKRK